MSKSFVKKLLSKSGPVFFKGNKKQKKPDYLTSRYESLQTSLFFLFEWK